MKEIYKYIDTETGIAKYIGKVCSEKDSRTILKRLQEHNSREFWVGETDWKIERLAYVPKDNGEKIDINKLEDNDIKYIENHLIGLYETYKYHNKKFYKSSYSFLSTNKDDYKWEEVTTIRGCRGQLNKYCDWFMTLCKSKKNTDNALLFCEYLLNTATKIANKFFNDKKIGLTYSSDGNITMKLVDKNNVSTNTITNVDTTNVITNTNKSNSDKIAKRINDIKKVLSKRNAFLEDFVWLDNIKNDFCAYGRIIKIEEKISTNTNYNYPDDRRYWNVRFRADNGEDFTIQIWREKIDKFKNDLEESRKNPSTRYFIYCKKKKNKKYNGIVEINELYKI